MKTTGFIMTLRQEGELLADAAEHAGWDGAVPPCPEWTVRDLVSHTGAVHRWAAGFVAGRTTPVPIAAEEPVSDDELSAWFRDGHRELVNRLEAAPAGLECWTFLQAPSPLEFWARRQAHETTVHRVDAEAALGVEPTPIAADFAVNGIDELLSGFHTRERSRVRSEAPRALRVQATDREGNWLVRLSGQSPQVTPGGSGPADCTVSGTAADLYLALWNRIGSERLQVQGDGSLLDLWQRTSAIT